MSKKNLFILVLLLVITATITATAILLPKKSPTPANNAADTNTAGNTATFVCDNGASITATFYPANDTRVDVKLSDGRALSVPRAISASGARYATEDESFVFWNKGDTAFITENGAATYDNCAIPGTGKNPTTNSCEGGTCPAPTPISTESWKTYSDEKISASFKYPQNLSTAYINTVDWPPQIKTSDETFNCVESGSEIESTGKTEYLAIDNRQYCITKKSEGAAGSTYTQYAYTVPVNGKTAILIFTLRFPQCGNYSDPQKTECETERTSFDINAVIDQIAQTIKINK